MDFEKPTWGDVDPKELRRIVVLSPHFDDAAMGAGELLIHHAGRADTTVVTVLGGPPPAYPDEPTEWDALGGFVAGDDVVAMRREEDRAAMDVLGATPIWLEFPDHQYLAVEDRPTPDQVAPVLEDTLVAAKPTSVVIPMGLANPDHVVTHDAALQVRTRHPEWSWFAYEDHGYKHLPGMLAWRVSKLFRAGVWPTPALVPISLDEDRKRRAIWCYRSQIPPLERDHALTARLEVHAPEQFWRLAPPPRGWERLNEWYE
ncbi:MAG: PIG-L family deacetylase [Acidimicrobiaceae bacterium]|nr:PIG-L family deacetylase [Acidimicrobiaceae bacterium]